MIQKSNEMLVIVGKPGESVEQATARASLDPTITATVTVARYSNLGNAAELDITALAAELVTQSKAIQSGDLSRAGEMLTAQAHSLDAIFNRLAIRALDAEYMDNMQTYLKLALRAQSQSRATWEALSAIQNPPIAGYIKQANIAGGHQQVNNGERAQETEKAQSKLLEKTDGNRLDFRATQPSGAVDTPLETVDAEHGSED